MPPWNTALCPLHLRPSGGWQRRNNGCSLDYIIDVPRHPQQPVYPDCGRFVQATQLLLRIQFFSFVCASGINIFFIYFFSCVVRDWDVNTLACAHEKRRGEIDTSDSRLSLIASWFFTSEQANCWLQWRQFRRCLFWITLILCLRVKMAKSSPTARLVARESRRSGVSRPTS